ncbi:hypothetical protein [Bacillus subtilis]|uniref:hypothetical protein n=1 Tax=Bacillus subtilis TaxID=1423 RepID=UPI00202A3A41|nr:hypothetical protein [Bacillus subtilis]
MNAPDAGFITVTSFIPFFTPMIMFLRVGMLDIPFWQAAVGIGITLLTILYWPRINLRQFKRVQSDQTSATFSEKLIGKQPGDSQAVSLLTERAFARIRC